MNILLTCAGRRNYLVIYFKQALNGIGKIIATDAQLSAPALVDADIAIKVPSVYDENYINTLIKICKNHAIKALLSLNDLELPLIAANKERFEAIGTIPIISDLSIVELCFDKWKTNEFLAHLDLKIPKTYLTLNHAIDAINKKELNFPVVIKPRWGSASIGVEFPESEEELALAYKLLSIRLSKTISTGAGLENAEQAILIQEKLTGQEYGMDVLNDLNGNFVASFAKKKLAMRDGETDKAETISKVELDQIGKALGLGLKHIGNLDVDVFETEKGFYVLELNPRFGGGYPFTHEAGVNVPKILLEWLNKRSDINRFINFNAGKAFSKCDRVVEVPMESSQDTI